MRFADGRMQFLRSQEALGVFSVVGEDIGAELDLAARLIDALAHLKRHSMRKCLCLFMEERRRFGDDFRPLGISFEPPRLETFCGGCELFL